METLATSLKDARSRQRMTLETASAAAGISAAYLHKLEAGRVRTPSPHVLRRLAAVLRVPYLRLMTLAGYLDSSEARASATASREGAPTRKGDTMTPAAKGGAPTNAEIVRLLQALQAEIGELKRGQKQLAAKLEKAASRTTGA